MRFGPKVSLIAGVASGVFGGLVGNQGGIRSAAMLGLGLKGPRFVATATAIALAVDGARLPFYLVAESEQILGAWPAVVTAVAAVIATAALTSAASASPFFLFGNPSYGDSQYERGLPGSDYDSAARLRRQVVEWRTGEGPGTIVIDTANTYLYLVLGQGHGRAISGE